MSQLVIQEVLQNFTRTIGLLRETIGGFNEEKWRIGFTWFQVPVRVARHTIECLDFYFKAPGAPFSWGTRFGRPYWETPDPEQPSQDQILAYLDDMEEKIKSHFQSIQDEDLSQIFDESAEEPCSRLKHYLYALRHTVHHTGGLIALADIQEQPSAEWEKWV